jgi:hypothetical protein
MSSARVQQTHLQFYEQGLTFPMPVVYRQADAVQAGLLEELSILLLEEVLQELVRSWVSGKVKSICPAHLVEEEFALLLAENVGQLRADGSLVCGVSCATGV